MTMPHEHLTCKGEQKTWLLKETATSQLCNPSLATELSRHSGLRHVLRSAGFIPLGFHSESFLAKSSPLFATRRSPPVTLPTISLPPPHLRRPPHPDQ